MAEISPAFKQSMNDIACDLDFIFNGGLKGADRKNGFVLLVFPFDGPAGQRVNYISNASRKDIVVMMKEVLARFEGQPEHQGTA